MRELGILIKYRLMNFSPPKMKGGRRANPKMMILYFIIFVAIFGISLFPVMSSAFDQLASLELGPNSLIPSGYNLADLFFALVVFILMAVMLMNFLPYLIYSLSDETELAFLRTLPVSKGILLVYKSVDAIISSFMTIAMFLPVFLAYMFTKGVMGYVLVLPLIIVTYALPLVISFLIACLLSGKISAVTSKKISGILVLLDVVIFLGLIYMTSMIRNPSEKLIEFFVSFGTNELIPSTWILKAANGSLIDWLLLIVLVVWIFRITFRIANKKAFEGVGSGSSKTWGKVNFNKKMGVMQKDFKILSREGNSMFFMFYPIILGALMMFVSQDILMPTIFMVVIASFYSSQLMVIQLAPEFTSWPIPLSFPIKFKSLFESKIKIVMGVFTLEYMLILVVGMIFYGFNPLSLLTIITAGITFYVSAKLGAYFYLSSGAFKAGAQMKRLGTKQVLILELVTILIAFGTIIVPGVYLNSFSSEGLNEWLHGIINNDTILAVIAIAIPVLVSFFSLRITSKKLNSEIKKIKEGM